MITREVVASYAPPREITLTAPRNRTSIAVFSSFSVAMYGLSIAAFMNGRWEAYLTFALANVCAGVAVLTYFSRNELSLHPRDRFVRTRRGIGPLRFERQFSFDSITTVRLTLSGVGRPKDCSIELVTAKHDIHCPPTLIPRQQALFLAVLIGAQLLKIENTAPRYGRAGRNI